MDFWAKTVEPGKRADVHLKPNEWIYLKQAVLEDPGVTGPVILLMKSLGEPGEPVEEVTLGEIIPEKDPNCLFVLQYAIRRDFQLSHDGDCSVYFYGYTATIKNFDGNFPTLSDSLDPLPGSCPDYVNIAGALSEDWNFNEGTGGETSAGDDMMSQLETEKLNAPEE